MEIFYDPGAGHLTTVDINFLIYKMGIIIPVLLIKNQLRFYVKNNLRCHKTYYTLSK